MAHHHYPPPAESPGVMDQVVHHAQMREAHLKSEVDRELGQRDMREAHIKLRWTENWDSAICAKPIWWVKGMSFSTV